MARVACRRESCGLVVGIVGVVVILHVACAAGFVCQVIVAVHVALQAGQGFVCSGQWKPRSGVIELPAAPGIGVVAILASGGKARLLVVRIVRVLVVLQVAGYAARVSDVVIAVDVAL